MSSVLQVDLPWLTLRAKLVQEDERGILYRTMFDNYILDNSKFQMVKETGCVITALSPPIFLDQCRNHGGFIHVERHVVGIIQSH